MKKSSLTWLAAVVVIGIGIIAAPSFPGRSAIAAPAQSPPPIASIYGDFTSPKPLTLLYTTFQDHAVLQRDKPVPLWGMTTPRASVTVAFGDATAGATADAEGHWRVVLAPMRAGGPYSMTARSSDGTTQTITDVMIGDVFLCSGQSNMEQPVRVVSNYDVDVKGASNTAIRLFHVERYSSAAPRDTFGADASWAVTSPATVGDFSAACYNFGKTLQPVVQVPIGLIEDAWGGSIIQAWLSAEKLHELGGHDPMLAMLRDYARSPEAADRDWRAFANGWWLAHDPASAALPPWHDPAYDDSNWASIIPTGSWREWPVPALKTFDGIVWLREAVELSADQAGGEAVLSLGAIDRSDIAWVNGHQVGAGQGYDIARDYDVPAGTLHAGKNVIAVGVIGGAGMLTPADRMTLKLADGTVVRLTTPWRYRISASQEKTGAIANIPWLNQFGLSTLYNGMIKPLGSTQLRGVVWYQGESNAFEPLDYGRLLSALIDDDRHNFGADLPFIVVQLPNYGPFKTNPEMSGWAALREEQRHVANTVPNTGLVVTIDIGQTDNIHPTNKQELGRRIALVAERLVYGMAVADSGPTPLSAIRQGDKVIVRFAHVETGLSIFASNRPVGFQACDADRRCRYVDAWQNNDEIEIAVPHAGKAQFIRYCWADSPICNLTNSTGLPAVPFEMPIMSAGTVTK